MQTSSLLTTISQRCSDKSILETVSELFGKYKVDWFALEGSGEPIFIASSLSTAKGLNSTDFKNHYMPEVSPSDGPTSETQTVLDNGTIAYGETGIFLLKGEYLTQAKRDCPNSVSKFAPNVLACHWERAAHYLAQGHSEAAKETVAMMAEATRRQAERERYPLELQAFYREANSLNKMDVHRIGGERWLQQQFLLIASHTDLKYRAEYGLCFDGKQRYLDLIRKLPRKLQVVEFSLPAVTAEKVEEKLLIKDYPAALAAKHGNRLQEYIFSSPFGVDNEALALINKLDGQVVNGTKLRVSYKPYSSLIDELIIAAFATTPSECHWRLQDDMMPLIKALPAKCLPNNKALLLEAA